MTFYMMKLDASFGFMIVATTENNAKATTRWRRNGSVSPIGVIEQAVDI